MTLGHPNADRGVERDGTHDRRAARHAATRTEIVDAAWAAAREHGLAGLTLADVASRVGMRAPSLYSYFSSKADLYDAMFARGWSEYLEAWERLEVPEDRESRIRAHIRLHLRLAVADPTRYQLLFQRTVPGFEPSPASWAAAREAYRRLVVEPLAEVGVTDPADVDLATALGAGLAAQQLANDPGGDRWLRLADDAASMFLAHVRSKEPT